MLESQATRNALSNKLENLADRVKNELERAYGIEAAIVVVRGILVQAFEGSQPPTAPSDGFVAGLAQAMSLAENDRGVIEVRGAIANVRAEAKIRPAAPSRTQDDGVNPRPFLRVPVHSQKQADYYNGRRRGRSPIQTF